MIRFVYSTLATGLFMTVVGCQGDALTDVVPQRLSPEEAYWSLSARYKAVNLAVSGPYNSLQLEVTPYNARGDSIPIGEATPVYSALDTARVRVTRDGLLTARATGNNIIVLASLQIGTVTHVDTIWVRVSATAPASPLATFSIQPGVGDSTKWSWGGDQQKQLTPVARNAANGNVNQLQVHWSVSNRRIATVEPSGTTNALLTGKTAGRLWVRASVYAYGVFLTDSVEYVIGYPLQQIIMVDRFTNLDGSIGVVFHPANVTVGVGGVVMWDYRGQWLGIQSPGLNFDKPEFALAPVDCIFGIGEVCRDPMLFDVFLFDVKDGNAQPRPVYDAEFGGAISLTMTLRQWNAPGTYVFRDHWGKQTGSVTVKDNSGL